MISILGAGWLGLPLGEALAREDHLVLGSTTRSERKKLLAEAGLEPHLIRVGEQVEGEFLDRFFSSDILLLNIPPGRRQPDVEERYPRQIQLIYQLALAGGLRRLLFISSTGVYGDLNRIVTEADPPTDPERGSGRALATVESFLRRQTALEYTIVRMAGLVGGERKAGRFLAGRSEVPNPEGPVNLVHLDDCIGVIREIIRQEKWGEIYNVCSDEHPTRREFYTAQALKEGLTPPTFLEGDPPRFKIISNEKVKQELGYRFQWPDPMGF